MNNFEAFSQSDCIEKSVTKSDVNGPTCAGMIYFFVTCSSMTLCATFQRSNVDLTE